VIADYFDHAFFINLDRRPDRRKSFEEQVKQIPMDVERISAVDAPEKLPGYTAKGEVGCKLSHLNTVKLAQERKYSRVLIFEDDSYFIPEFMNKLLKAVSEIKKLSWDLFYLDYSLEKVISTGSVLTRLKSTWRCTAYAVNSCFYRQYILQAEREHRAIDRTMKDIQAVKFATTEKLVVQCRDVGIRNGDSDIWSWQ